MEVMNLSEQQQIQNFYFTPGNIRLAIRNSDVSLVSYSIFKYKDHQLLKTGIFQELKQDEILKFSRFVGCLYSLALGDSLGHINEFNQVDYKRNSIKQFNKQAFQMYGCNHFRLKPGQWTDDSSMAWCLADSLIKNKELSPIDLRLRFCLWWYCGYNNAFKNDQHRFNKRSVGLGGNISMSLHQFLHNNGHGQFTKAGDQQTSGNGGIMRLGPMPLFCHNKSIQETMELCAKQSKTTHQGFEAADCARILGFIIWKALNYKAYDGKVQFIKQFFDSLSQDIQKELIPNLQTETGKHIARSKNQEQIQHDKFNKVKEDRFWDWKSKDHRFSPTRENLNSGYLGSYACDGLTMALHICYHTSSIKQCLLRVVNLGGDADTVGAIAGQMVGSVYGYKVQLFDWTRQVLRWDDCNIGLRCYKLFKE